MTKSSIFAKLMLGQPCFLDRMDVRVEYSKSENIGHGFDEVQHRITRDLRYEGWAEFMVVWREDRVELYQDFVSRLIKGVVVGRTDMFLVASPWKGIVDWSQASRIHHTPQGL